MKVSLYIKSDISRTLHFLSFYLSFSIPSILFSSLNSFSYQANTSEEGSHQSHTNGRQLVTRQLELKANLAKNPEKALLERARWVLCVCVCS